MAEYHVGCGAFAIYAGTLNSKNKNLWQNKTECTDEAINAVRDYMVSELLGGVECRKAVSSGYEWKLKDGRTVELRVTVKEAHSDDCEHDFVHDLVPSLVCKKCGHVLTKEEKREALLFANAKRRAEEENA